MEMTRSAALVIGLGCLATGFGCSGSAPVETGPEPYAAYSVAPDAAERLHEAARWVGPPPAPPRGLAFDAEHYEFRATIDPAAERLRASARIWLGRVRGAASDTVRLKVGDGLRIERVEVDGESVRARRGDGELIVPLPASTAAQTGIVVSLDYEAPSRRGLRISEEAAFTYFHTDSWLPVHGDLDDRATIDLMLVSPGWTVVGPGTWMEPPGAPIGRPGVRMTPETPRVIDTPRRVIMEPVPPYLFGFAAAPLQQVYLENEDYSSMGVLVDFDVPETDIRRAFRDAWRMVDFLERKAGIPFPAAVYRQVLLPDAPPQELLGQTLLPRGYLDTVLADSTEDYLIIHELAHQWWGTRVLAADWSEFWLQEGVVSFLVAAWKEDRWGADAYEREIRLARERVGRARENGPPRALVDSAFATSATAGGAIPYSMGLLALHELRGELGDAAFWRGFARFTKDGFRAPAGVTSEDLRRAMEAASGRDLEAWFARWVYAKDPELGG